METFISGFFWAAGLLLSLAAFRVVRKSYEREVCRQAAVWFVASCPIALAWAAALRLMNLLARKPLVLTDLPEDRGIDTFLVYAGDVLLLLHLVPRSYRQRHSSCGSGRLGA